jgi:cell division protein FtsI (penicillin-binding protein 3)
METETVACNSNLGRAADGTYYETTNYAVAESRGLPCTFKLVDLMAILEDKAADTSTVYDTIWWCIHGGRSVWIAYRWRMVKFL